METKVVRCSALIKTMIKSTVFNDCHYMISVGLSVGRSVGRSVGLKVFWLVRFVVRVRVRVHGQGWIKVPVCTIQINFR